MILANYQKQLVNKIYDLLVNDDLDKGITLSGPPGSGKSTIAQDITNQLKEGWSIFYVSGINIDDSPYFTWHIGTKLYVKSKLDLGVEASLSFDFTPMTFGLTTSFQRIKENFVLSSNEDALLACIKQQAGVNKKILIIADNYESWDIPSINFLKKIACLKSEVFAKYHINILLISQDEIAIDVGLKWSSICINNISDDDILCVLRQSGFSENFNIKDIRLCAGNDLSLSMMAAEYYTNNSNALNNDFNQLMEKRYEGLSEEKQEACKVLEPLSIIESHFTTDETAFFLNESAQNELEIKHQATAYLTLAEEENFIVKDGKYFFTNNKVREYFNFKISLKEHFYHAKFSCFLQKHHPEDYFNRAKHLKKSLKMDDVKTILKSWQLLFLSYVRRSFEYGDWTDVYNILPEIEMLIGNLNDGLRDNQLNILNELKNAYKEFSNYNYNKALVHFLVISPSELIPACLAECQRLILLCHVQLAENSSDIARVADELYRTIESDDFCEDDQYCRAALVLLDVYFQRVYDLEKNNFLKNKFNKIISKHIGNIVFEELGACYSRKAALYYTAVIACKQTERSLKYYKRHYYNQDGLYMALCNHSANSIVAGNYSDADQALVECKELIKSNTERNYPSPYKVVNNINLLNYLQKEKQAVGDREKTLLAAEKAAAVFFQLKKRQNNEISYVSYLNYLALSALSGSETWHNELENDNHLLTISGEYYQYYFHDLNFASALIQNKLAKAEHELSILEKLNPQLLVGYKKIFTKRRKAQKKLLSCHEPNFFDSFEYHQFILKECNHTQDSSDYFYGRAFLLSDLQFLSL